MVGRHACRSFPVVVLLALCSIARAQAPDPLLAKLPMGANAIVVADVEKFLASPLSEHEGWNERTEGKAPSSMCPLPSRPGLKKIYLSAQLDLQSMEPSWQAGLITLDREIKMKTIATGTGGYLDSVADRDAAFSGAGTLFIHLEDKLLGAVMPGNRQFATMWVQQMNEKPKSPTGYLSSYLARAAAQVSDNTQVVMAIDGAGAVPVNRIRKVLQTDPPSVLAAKNLTAGQQAEVAGVIASIQGLTMKISVGEKAAGVMTIDFGQNIKPIADVAKDLTLEIMADKGAAIPDLAMWTWTTTDRAIIAKGEFTDMGLRRVLSVLMPPDTPEDRNSKDEEKTNVAQQPNQPGQPAAANQMVVASQKYFKTITGILDNLKPGPSLGDQAAWLNRYSKRIDQMPMVGVDPELVAWGAEVSSALRTCAVMLANGQGQVRAAVATVAAPTHYLDYSVVNPANVDDAEVRAATSEYQRQRRQISLDVKQQATAQAFQPLQAVLDSRPKVRAQMVERYGVEF